jgi:glycosyltransferase involved in cell wall biosynthesis
MKALPNLSIFFPCYNDAGTIKGMVEQASETGKALTDDLELIVVDDGSRDESPEILAELVGSIPELKVVRHPANRGYGGALKSGFSNVSKDFIFYTDGDGQYDIKELPLLAGLMEDGIDLVNGYKLNRSDAWYRKVIGAAYRYFMRLLFGIRIRDIDCDFRLFRRRLLEGVEFHSDAGSICVEMLSEFQRKGAVFVEVGVHHYPRRYGQSQFFTFRHVSLSILALVMFFCQMKITGRR